MAALNELFEGLGQSVEALPKVFQALGQSTESASKNAQAFSESCVISRQSLGLFASMLGGGEIGHLMQEVKHSFEQLGPIAGGIAATLLVLRAAFEAQTKATEAAAERSNGFSKALKESRQFLDDVKDSPLQEQLNKIAENVAKANKALLAGPSTYQEILGTDIGEDELKTAIKNFGLRANEIRQRMQETGDTGVENKHVGEVGGAGNRAVGARDLGSYQIDHTVAMVQLLAQIAANTSSKSGQPYGNPNSSISGSGSWTKNVGGMAPGMAATLAGPNGMNKAGMGGLDPTKGTNLDPLKGFTPTPKKSGLKAVSLPGKDNEYKDE